MTYSTHFSSVSLGRSAAAVKDWIAGGPAKELISPAQRLEGDLRCPGAYALLVGIDRR